MIHTHTHVVVSCEKLLLTQLVLCWKKRLCKLKHSYNILLTQNWVWWGYEELGDNVERCHWYLDYLLIRTLPGEVKIYLVTRIGNLNLGSHWSVCLNKMEINAARECLESHRNMSFSVNSLFWLSYSIWCNHFLPPNSLLSLKSCVIGAMHGLQGFVDTAIHIMLWLLFLIC